MWDRVGTCLCSVMVIFHLHVRKVVINFLKGSLCNSALSLLLKTKHYWRTQPQSGSVDILLPSVHAVPTDPEKESQSEVLKTTNTQKLAWRVASQPALSNCMTTYRKPVAARSSGHAWISIVSLQRMQHVRNAQWLARLCSSTSLEWAGIGDWVLSYVCPVAAWETRRSLGSL